MGNPVTLLIVENLQRSKAFYLEVLSTELIEENDDCIKLRIGNHEILMFQGTSQAVEYQHGYSSNSTLVFSVDDVDIKMSELKLQGVEFVHETVNQNKWGRYAAFKDPSGIIHELMEFHLP